MRPVCAWWRHQMETFSALLALYPVEFTGYRWITRTKANDAEFWRFFDLQLTKRLSKKSRCWWFETPLHPLWRHCNGRLYVPLSWPGPSSTEWFVVVVWPWYFATVWFLLPSGIRQFCIKYGKILKKMSVLASTCCGLKLISISTSIYNEWLFKSLGTFLDILSSIPAYIR